MEKLTTKEVMQAMRNTFGDRKDYAYLEQVRNQTGFTDKRLRIADAITMGLYPSRGLYIEGYEVKVSRSDWLSELKQPEKADDIAGYCHYWWIVAPKDIITVDEMPHDWGLS